VFSGADTRCSSQLPLFYSFVDVMVVVWDVLKHDFINRKRKGRPVTCCIFTKYEWMHPVALLALKLGIGWRWVWVVNDIPRLIYLLNRTTGS